LAGAAGMQLSAISLVIWALRPIALVSAPKETAIVFAVIIGVVMLKKRLNLARLASMDSATMLKLNR
jgi:hypothetical protein